MVNKTSRQSRKPAGSSGRVGSSVSRGRSRHQGERPQAPPTVSPYRGDNKEYVDEYPKNTDLQRRDTSTLRTSRLAQLLEAQQDQPSSSTSSANCTSSLSIRTSSSFANRAAIINGATIAGRTSNAAPTYAADRLSRAKRISELSEGDTSDDSSKGSEDWEELAHQIPLPSSPSSSTRSSTPSYNFPGTWPAALHDSAEALVRVGCATKSYASALTKSGIGKASWSIGAPALHTTNKYALNLAGWGMDQTGLMPSELPGPIKKWITKHDEANKRKKLAEERRRRLQLLHGETVEGTFDDEQGAFKLDLHQTDRDGEFVGSAPSSYPKKIGWKEESESEKLDESVGQQGDYMEEGSDKEEDDDGLMRVFEFDD